MVIPMAASDYTDRFVIFPHGRIVPAPAVVLLLDLESRGFTLTTEDRTTLVVSPPEKLTRLDCAALRRWKWHVLGLLAYTPDDSHLFGDIRPSQAAIEQRRPA